MDWRTRLSKQTPIFGEQGIAAIRNTRLVIVGMGGNGSAFALFAGYIGFLEFCLVDYDRLEESNLNRMLCASYGDLNRFKVDIVKRRLEEIYPEIKCLALPYDVADRRSGDVFSRADVIVSAVDRNDARAFLQKRSMELGKPLLDLGSGGLIQDGKPRFLGSRASLYMPGQACLYCQTLEDDDPSLSLVSLVIPNVIAAAAGLALLLSWLTGYGEKANFVFYDALSHSMSSLMVKKAKECPYCGRENHG